MIVMVLKGNLAYNQLHFRGSRKGLNSKTYWSHSQNIINKKAHRSHFTT